MRFSTKILFLFFFLFLGFALKASFAYAADRYWVGGTGNWSDATNHWATVSGGTPGAGNLPTSADNCFFDVSSSANSYTVTADVAMNCLDMTWANPATGSPTLAGTGTMHIYGSLTFVSGMTKTWTGYTTFDATTTGKTITMNGFTFADVYFQGAGGGWTLQDAFSGSVLYFNKGTLNTNGQSLTMTRFVSGGSNTRTLTLGSSAVTLSYTGASTWATDTATNFTMTANTANVTFSGGEMNTQSAAQFDFNGLSVIGMSKITNGGTFANVTYNGGATKTATLTLGGTTTITGTFTVNGNSSINRVLIQSSSLGTAATVNSAANSLSNVDFRDITGAGAASWNLSAITGLSGDALGNSGITFTTATTSYWTGNTGSWSVANQWCTSSGGCSDNAGNGRVPLPQDNVVFDNGSFNGTTQTVTLDMPRVGANMDWSAYNEGQNPTMSTAVNPTVYGSVTFNSGMTLSGAGYSLSYEGRGSHTLDYAGKNWNNTTFINAFGGTYTLSSALTVGNYVFSVANGTFNANNYNVTVTNFSSTGTTARTVSMGSGTWTITSTGNVWNFSNVTNLTFDPGTSNIVLSNTTATAKTFIGNGKTFYNVTFSGDNITVTGSNTFSGTFALDALNTNGVLLTAGTTQTIANFTSNGDGTNKPKLRSTTTSNATIAKSGGGTVNENYMDIDYITGSTTNTWYMGFNSTNGGHNVNLIFENGARSASTPDVKISSSAGTAIAWYNSSWGYRKKITVPAQTSLTGGLTNFPMLFSVTDPDLRDTGSGGKTASSTAGDLLFVDWQGGKMDHEIEKYANTTGETIAWVKVPYVSSTSTREFYLYYGNASATYQPTNSAVWDASYKGVWHLDETLTAAGQTVKDSTGANNGTSVGTWTGGQQTAGKVVGSLTFNGADNRISASGTGSLRITGSTVTMESWFYCSGSNATGACANSNGGLLGKVTTQYSYQQYVEPANQTMDAVIRAGSINYVAYSHNSAQGALNAYLNSWVHLVTVYNGSTIQLYVNGAPAPKAPISASGTIESTTDGFAIGDRGDATNMPFNNSIDEVRVSDSARSADWVATEYNNQNSPSGFYSYGGQEAQGGRQGPGGSGTAPAFKVRGGVKFR